MLRRKSFWLCLLVLLYAFTWIGGWITYAHQLQERAEGGYLMAQKENEEAEFEAHYSEYKPHLIKLREGGPTSRVWWCVPVLPGVLLADSEYDIGQGWGGGGLWV